MKKIVLFIAVYVSIAVNAQNFVYTTSQHIDTATASSGLLVLDIYFETQTAEDITYKFLNLTNTLPDTWDVGMCDYTSCYIGIPSQGTMTPISQTDASNGVRGFFKLNVDNVNVLGDGWLKLYVYDENDFDRGDTVSWHITFGALSVANDLEQAAFEVWPNPCVDIINVSVAGNYNITVFNQLGAKVFSFESKGVTSISTSDWEDGLYLVTVLNEKGILSTKKVIIQ